MHLVKKLCSFFLLDIQNIHGEQAGKRDRGGSAVGARHTVREHDTTQPVLNKDIKRAQGQTAPGVPRKRVLGVKVLLRAGARRPGEKLARPSPARPSFDPDHALPFVLSPHFPQVDSPSTTGT